MGHVFSPRQQKMCKTRRGVSPDTGETGLEAELSSHWCDTLPVGGLFQGTRCCDALSHAWDPFQNNRTSEIAISRGMHVPAWRNPCPGGQHAWQSLQSHRQGCHPLQVSSSGVGIVLCVSDLETLAQLICHLCYCEQKECPWPWNKPFCNCNDPARIKKHGSFIDRASGSRHGLQWAMPTPWGSTVFWMGRCSACKPSKLLSHPKSPHCSSQPWTMSSLSLIPVSSG